MGDFKKEKSLSNSPRRNVGRKKWRFVAALRRFSRNRELALKKCSCRVYSAKK